MNLTELGLRETSRLLGDGEISAMELLDGYLRTALKGCCITFCSELAYETSKNLDNRRRFMGPLSPIEGIPFSLKDNIQTAGILTTCNSKSLRSHIPDSDAAITKLLLGQSAVLTAKNCMREFSVGKIEDSAYELRNYLVWAGTSNNINIGAFSIGTDLGLCDSCCGLWTLKPYDKNGALSKGIITGSPSLERLTFSARRGDDIKFLYPAIVGGQDSEPFTPKEYRAFVCDELNISGHIARLLAESGIAAHEGSLPFLDKAELAHDCILAAEFFNSLSNIGRGSLEHGGAFAEEGFIHGRTEGFGFEVKRLILTGAFLFSPAQSENTLKVLDYGVNGLTKELLALLNEYDFIAAPVVYGEKLSKASAVAGFPELTVPFGDVLPFKIVTKPERESLLPELAAFLSGRI